MAVVFVKLPTWEVRYNLDLDVLLLTMREAVREYVFFWCHFWCVNDESAFQPFRLVPRYRYVRGSPTYLRALCRHFLRGVGARSLCGDAYILS